MKKYLKITAFILCIIIMLSACSAGKTFYGESRTYMTGDVFIIVLNDNGKETGFFVTEKTRVFIETLTRLRICIQFLFQGRKLLPGKKPKNPRILFLTPLMNGILRRKSTLRNG